MGGGKLHMVKLESPGIVEPRLYKPVIGDDKPFNPQHLLDLNVPSIIFGANNFAHELPNNHRWLVWFKKQSLEFKRNNFSDVELCWTNLKGKSCLMYHHSWSGMVREGDRKTENTDRPDDDAEHSQQQYDRRSDVERHIRTQFAVFLQHGSPFHQLRLPDLLCRSKPGSLPLFLLYYILQNHDITT